MTAHIDTLKEWWENAEVGDPKDGDVIIEWAGDGHAVRTFREDERDNLYAACTYRILARAPKPKPAWHDAVAVMARCSNAPEGHREPFIRSEATRDVWAGEAGHARTEDLRDVTPLIEAKVTDEMVLAALNASTGLDMLAVTSFKRDEIEDMRYALTAALGLESA